MKILIAIFGIINFILIYYVDIILSDIIAELLLDVLGTVFLFFIIKYFYEKYEFSLKILNWFILIDQIFSLLGILFFIYKKELINIQSTFSTIIPITITYFSFLIWKRKNY